MGGEDEDAGAEGGTGGVFFGFEVDGGEEGALDLAGEENGAAGGGELRRREPVGGHGLGSVGRGSRASRE